MFATQTIIATLALSSLAVAQQVSFDGGQPTSGAQGAQTLMEVAGAVTVAPGGDGGGATPGPGMARWRFAEPGSVQFGTQSPAAGEATQVPVERTGHVDLGMLEPEPEPLMLRPGVTLIRCGVAVTNLEASSQAIALTSSGDGCFTDITIGDGAHAAIDVGAAATGLEYLQVTVMGRAFLEVTGEQGLGEYDPREPVTSKAGILVDGNGLTASDQEELATITLKSSHNVVETLGASRDHEIKVEGASNLIRLHGEDQVLGNAPDTRVLWLPPMFLL